VNEPTPERVPELGYSQEYRDGIQRDAAFMAWAFALAYVWALVMILLCIWTYLGPGAREDETSNPTPIDVNCVKSGPS